MLIDQHQAGESDHSAALWSLSMIESFLRQVHPPSPALTSLQKVGNAV